MNKASNISIPSKENVGGVHILGLGLQGGAAHGAYTWGVLDRLLEEPDINIGAISGASSGAFNTALIAHGLAQGSPELAKETLHEGWMGLSEAAADLPRSFGSAASPFRSMEFPILTPFGFQTINYDKAVGTWPNLSHWMHQMYMGNYSDIPDHVYERPGSNPILDITERLVDFEAIQNGPIDVYVNAINGRTQKHTVFTGNALTAQSIAASANLRYMMAAVEIDGDEYWDGGYLYNPYFDPLANHSSHVTDIKAVMLNPVDQEEGPTNGARAEQRLNGSVFSSGAYENLAGIDRMNHLLMDFAQATGVDITAIKKMQKRIIYTHRLQMPVTSELGTSSKYNLDPDFLTMMRDRGRTDENDWLAANKQHLGKRSTFDAKGFARADYQGQDSDTSPQPAVAVFEA